MLRPLPARATLAGALAGILTLVALTPAQAEMRLAPLGATSVAAVRGADCAVPFADAKIVNAAVPSLPAIAEGQGASGATVLALSLAPSGALIKLGVLRSSGNLWLDREALTSARRSAYAAQVIECAAVGGEYALTIDFAR